MAECRACGASFEPPPTHAIESWDQVLCPERCFPAWLAAQDQREAEARDQNALACALDGHVMSEPYCSAECERTTHPECFARASCLRCGVKESELVLHGD